MKRNNKSFWLTLAFCILVVSTGAVLTGAVGATTAPGPVTVVFTITADWGNGCVYNVTVRNNTPAVIPGGWRLSWTLIGDQKIVYPSPPIIVQTGSDVTYTAPLYLSIPANGGTATFGFNVAGTGRGVTNVKFNGVPVGQLR